MRNPFVKVKLFLNSILEWKFRHTSSLFAFSKRNLRLVQFVTDLCTWTSFT